MNAESSIFFGAPGTMMGGWLAGGYLTLDRHGLGESLRPATTVLLSVALWPAWIARRA